MEGHVPGCQPLLSPVLLTMTRNRFLLFARLPWCNQMRARALAPSVPFKWKLPVRYLPTCWRPRDKCIRSHLRETWNNCITRDISARSGLELSDKFNQFAWEKAVYSLRVEIPDLQTSAVFLSVRLAVLPLDSKSPHFPYHRYTSAVPKCKVVSMTFHCTAAMCNFRRGNVDGYFGSRKGR